jgi:hypothetical protein
LPKHRFDKLFSVEDANELVPTLELLTRKIQSAASQVRMRVAELLESDPETARMDLPAIVARYPDVGPPAAALAELVHNIEALGCILKDIDMGLFDFPCAVGKDDIVFLCWQSGEPTVAAWHPVDAGFAQRKPLPGAAKPIMN